MTVGELIDRALWWAILVYSAYVAFRAGRRAEAAARLPIPIPSADSIRNDAAIRGMIDQLDQAERFAGAEGLWMASIDINRDGRRYLVELRRAKDD
jgi:hypothetical protein